MNMYNLFSTGDEIGGYCNGYFGRDNYDNKTCVIVTMKYAIFENSEGEGSILSFTERLIDDAKGDNWKPI